MSHGIAIVGTIRTKANYTGQFTTEWSMETIVVYVANTLESSILAPSLHSNQFFETKSIAGPAYSLQTAGSTSKA
jgi:hypothetical protein